MLTVCMYVSGSGSLRAKFELSDGPSIPATLAVQFFSEGSTLSGVDMELVGSGYRLSLNKKRFASGKNDFGLHQSTRYTITRRFYDLTVFSLESFQSSFVFEMAELSGDKMSICVCLHSQAAIWLTAEI